jgi:hypothetical protein
VEAHRGNAAPALIVGHITAKIAASGPERGDFLCAHLNVMRGDPDPVLMRAPRRANPGDIVLETIRPNTTDPIPLRTSPPKMGTIIVRFVGLLVMAVALLVWVWSR